MEYYIHYVRGRIRLQTPWLHENPTGAAAFTSLTKKVPGILSVDVRILTGSALVLFDEAHINCEQIIAILERNCHFSLALAETNDEVVEKATGKVLGVAEKFITDGLGEGIDGE